MGEIIAPLNNSVVKQDLKGPVWAQNYLERHLETDCHDTLLDVLEQFSENKNCIMQTFEGLCDDEWKIQKKKQKKTKISKQPCIKKI